MEKTAEILPSYDLNALVESYNIDSSYEQYKRFEFLEKLSNYIDLQNSTVLELGPATGQMTKLLCDVAKKVVAVDGSSKFIQIAKERVHPASNVIFHESYFEDFIPDEKVDCLIFHHILEHIEDPLTLLPHLLSYLKKGGIMALTVPNAYALSRQLAVKMGLLETVYELSENDIHHGHYRVYDWETLEEQLTESGFSVIGKHGLAFKLFSDRQNEEMFNANIIGEAQIKGLWELGDELPEVAGALMIIVQKI